MTRKPLDAEGIPLGSGRGKTDDQDFGGAGAPEQASGDVHGGRLEHPERPAEAVPAGPETPPPIRVSDRCCAIGMTGSGKSTILAAMWAQHVGQRILVDVNDAYELGPAALADPAGACYAEKLADIDWRKRTVHFVPRAQSERIYNDLYAAIYEQANMCVWLDESFGPTTPHRSPRWLRTVITQGRKRNIRHLAATQEPVNVLPVLYSQAEHLMVFQLTGRPDELRALSPRFGLSADELAAQLDALPEFGYLRTSTRAKGVTYRMPPLPAGLLERTHGHVVFAA